MIQILLKILRFYSNKTAENHCKTIENQGKKNSIIFLKELIAG